MHKTLLKFLFAILLSQVFLTQAFSETKKVLTVGFGMNKPPYVLENENSGLEVEIFREAARAAGYEIKSFFGPMERIKIMMIRGDLDAITNTNINERLNFYNSVPFIEYQNYAIALKKKNLKIKKVADLKNYSIASFQRARDLLGEDFAKVANQNKQYTEFADQKMRNTQLYKERVDVIIADKRIFKYFNTQLGPTIDHEQPVTMYNIFKVNTYQAAFHSEEIMKKFNQGVAKIRKNGTYHRLELKYSNYKPALDNTTQEQNSKK